MTDPRHESRGGVERDRLGVRVGDRGTKAGWIAAALLAAVVGGGLIFYAMSDRRDTAAVIPDATTGHSTRTPAPMTQPPATDR
jgi:hypothetical protein